MTTTATFENKPITEVRDYWNRRPCNIRHSPKPVGSKEYFDEVEQRKYFVEPHIPGFAQFSKWQGKKVLEIGCGIGTDTMNFARAGATVTAVDLSEKSIEVAKQRAEVFGLGDRIRFYQANAEELSQVVPVEPYDLIYSFGVIHHTPRPDRVVEQLKAYSKPGTTLKVMVYHRYSFKVLWIMLKYGKLQFWKTNEIVTQHAEAQFGCPIAYIYSKKQGRALLEQHGFKTSDDKLDHIFPYVIPEYVQYRYRKVWYFRWMPEFLFRALERGFGWHLCLTAEFTS